jgi:hypothetical protein
MSELLDDDDVLSMDASDNPVNNQTVLVSQVLQKIRNSLGSQIHKWVQLDGGEPGAECEVLRASAVGWRKGKVRLRVEFIPDEPSDEA